MKMKMKIVVQNVENEIKKLSIKTKKTMNIEDYQPKHLQTLHFSFFLLSSIRPLIVSFLDSPVYIIYLHRVETILQLCVVIGIELFDKQCFPLPVFYATAMIISARFALQIYEILEDHSRNDAMVHFLLLDNLILFSFLLLLARKEK